MNSKADIQDPTVSILMEVPSADQLHHAAGGGGKVLKPKFTTNILSAPERLSGCHFFNVIVKCLLDKTLTPFEWNHMQIVQHRYSHEGLLTLLYSASTLRSAAL